MTALSSRTGIERRSGFADILRDAGEFATGQTDGPSESVNRWFDRLMVQSGLQTSPSAWLMLCVVCALAAGGSVWVATESLTAAAFPSLCGLAAPIGLAEVRRMRRRKQILEQLPAMVEELARAARPGRSLEHALRLVAADTAAPLGDELRRAARRAEMGLDPASAIQDLPERTGVNALTLFASAVTVHQETGGDLIQVLERLAAAIRDRLHFTARLRAATIASRLGTGLMVLVPLVVLSFYVLRDPAYLSQLTASFWGRFSLITAILLQMLGCTLAWLILRRCSRF